MPKIQAATTNPGKLAELSHGSRLWSTPGEELEEWLIEALPGLAALPPCAEDGNSFAANAHQKAMHYSRFVKGLVLADDSGLEVAALGGEPGIHSARYAGPAATDEQNNAKLLRAMNEVPPPMRTARFVCELALAREGKFLARFTGVAEGYILGEPRGGGGFGYDPLFLDPMTGKTFAELSLEEKLRRSHRGKAVRGLMEWLATGPRSLDWSE
ncbi:MAG TPA: RdgB/HAM1 family non-canonical purine NTP pyrophosphatase [Terriglobia bacterium]|nr:RdgB/HAM1 family non-canonical purine NTP pyrophosphatase [Terriglobia bacterium]